MGGDFRKLSCDAHAGLQSTEQGARGGLGPQAQRQDRVPAEALAGVGNGY